MRIIEVWQKEVPIRMWQVVAISLALTGTWTIGIYGSWRYFDNQDYAACVERAELRSDVRGAFEVVFAYIESLGVAREVSVGALAAVDARIPAIDSADC